MMTLSFKLSFILTSLFLQNVSAFVSNVVSSKDSFSCASSQLNLKEDKSINRRDILSFALSGAMFGVASVGLPKQSFAASELLESVSSSDVAPTPQKVTALGDALYKILRVREATMQEARLIKSGKFKDVQRANVKLAVKFMIQNYRLNDCFVVAASFLENPKSVQAGEIGQTAVQYLYTILEYFDASDVQNLKVGTYDSMAGKEPLVVKGLEATKEQIDKFLAFFPESEVDTAKQKIVEENELNEKEFDVSNLGAIGNLSKEDIFK